MRITGTKAKCKYCGDYLVKGDYQIVCQVWSKKTHYPRRWKFLLRYHDYCWILQAKTALSMRPPKPETRGRKRMIIADGDKLARFKIMSRRAAVVQRIKSEISKPMDSKATANMIHFGEMLESLRHEIMAYGGVPKSWENGDE